MDVDAIPLGTNFVKALRDAVSKCDVLLAVIGPNWLDVVDDGGNRKLDDPDDFVRVEVAIALGRNIPVVPILLDDAKIPKAARLPADLKELAFRNGLEVRHASFRTDMGKLIKWVKEQTGGPGGSKTKRPKGKKGRRQPVKFIRLDGQDALINPESVSAASVDSLQPPCVRIYLSTKAQMTVRESLAHVVEALSAAGCRLIALHGPSKNEIWINPNHVESVTPSKDGVAPSRTRINAKIINFYVVEDVLEAEAILYETRRSSTDADERRTLVLEIGDYGRFISKRGDGLYKTKRTINVRVSNDGSSKAVGDCKVQISSIEPECGSGGPWVLKKNFGLAAGDEIYIPLAKYGEASTKSNYHDDVIEVCMPEGTAILRVPLLQTAERNRLIIRATGIDAPFAELGCELWIDEKGKLRIRDVSKEAAKITLHQAAIRAHEQLRHRPIAVFAERLTTSESDVLIWYCGAMVLPRDGKRPLVTLHGREPPSRIIEAIDIDYHTAYDFQEDAGAIILSDRFERRFVDLSIDENEVAEAIRQMSTWPSR